MEPMHSPSTAHDGSWTTRPRRASLHAMSRRSCGWLALACGLFVPTLSMGAVVQRAAVAAPAKDPHRRINDQIALADAARRAGRTIDAAQHYADGRDVHGRRCTGAPAARVRARCAGPPLPRRGGVAASPVLPSFLVPEDDQPVRFGHDINTARRWRGDLDEVRISALGRRDRRGSCDGRGPRVGGRGGGTGMV
jgi:hypothetical protein